MEYTGFVNGLLFFSCCFVLLCGLVKTAINHFNTVVWDERRRK
jgi:hypothetical protein